MLSLLMRASSRYAVDLGVLIPVLLAQGLGVYLLLQTQAARTRQWIRRLIMAAGGTSLTLIFFGFLLLFSRFSKYFTVWNASWIRGSAMIWAMLSVMFLAAWLARRGLATVIPAHSTSRRAFLNASSAALFTAPVLVTGYGVFVQRFNLRMREQKIVIPGLAQDLDGLRIVQLSDIHLSPFLSENELARAVAMANETKAHVALVTGDMISFNRDPLDVCLKHLAGLRSDAGIFGCLGNHEIYAGAEDYATELGARLGIRYLRLEAARLKFGGAMLNMAGVDYQRFHRPYLTGAEKLIEPGMLNVLLSHNPDVFPVATRQGYDLTIAGHTHGGQVRVEILREDLNVARFFTHYVDGLYEQNGKSIFVSRGIGTIGLPARLGAPPEVALLRLCRS